MIALVSNYTVAFTWPFQKQGVDTNITLPLPSFDGKNTTDTIYTDYRTMKISPERYQDEFAFVDNDNSKIKVCTMFFLSMAIILIVVFIISMMKHCTGVRSQMDEGTDELKEMLR